MQTEKEIDLLMYIVTMLVDKPDEVRIQRTEDEMWVLLTITAAKEDVWRIIWKEWRVASAIRMLLKVLWARNDMRINLKIVEPDVF